MPTLVVDQQCSANVKTSAAASAIGILLSVVAVIAVIVLTWQRLYVGVDFTDESFYAALQYRFALGDMPLRDEQNLTQFSAVLVLPLTRLFLFLQGSAEGLVLFLRQVHLLFTVLIGLSVVIAVRPIVGWSAALLTSAICLVFVPFNIHSPSYNTLGSGFWTIGCFLGLYATQRRLISRWPYFLSGIAHALAILAYPTLLVPVCLFVILFVFYAAERGVSRQPSSYIWGGLLVAVIPLTMVLKAGLGAVLALPAYFASVAAFGKQAGGVEKLWQIVLNFGLQVPRPGVLITGMLLLALWHWRKPSPMRFILPFLPLLLVGYSFGANGTAALYLVTAVGLFGPLVYPFVREDFFSKKIYRLVWCPSFVAGVITAWSSSNGTVNASIGMFPAALVSVLLTVRALHLMPTHCARDRVVQAVMMLVTPTVVVVPLLLGGYADVYGDPAPRGRGHTEGVTSGPFMGIRTTPEKNLFIQTLTQDLTSLVRVSDTVLFFNDFPAGYLFTSARPATNSIWLPSGVRGATIDRSPTLSYYEKNTNKPHLVFLLKKSDDTNDALIKMIKGTEYREIFVNEFFTAYRRQTVQNP